MFERPGRGDARNVLLVVLAVVLSWAPRLAGPIDLRWDAGVYYVLGTSLAGGHGYRLLNEPGEIEAVQYPPLLPAVVAAVQLALGTTDTVVVGHTLRLLGVAVSIAYGVAAYALARTALGGGLSLLAALLAVLHHSTYFLSDLLFTEIPFGLATVLFALAARRGRTLLAAVLGALAVLLRTQGMAALAAWVGEALLRRRWAAAGGRAALSLVPLLLWGAHVARVTHSPAYRGGYAYQRAAYQYYNVTYAQNLTLADPFRPEQGPLTAGRLASRIARNLVRLPFRLGEAASALRNHWEATARTLHLPASPGAVARLAQFLIGLAVLAGLLRLAARGDWLVPLYVLASYLLIATLPWPEQVPRYLAPVAPFLAFGLCLALQRLGALGQRRTKVALRAAAAAGVALVLAAQGHAIASDFGQYHDVAEQLDRSGTRGSARLFYYGPQWRSLDAALEWLRVHAAPQAVVATSAPHLAWLRAGRRAVMPPMDSDADAAQRLLDSVPASYLVLDGFEFADISRRYAAPVVDRHPALWELVFERGDVRVYRRRARAD